MAFQATTPLEQGSTNMTLTDSWEWNMHIYGFTGVWVLYGFYVFVCSVNLRAQGRTLTDCRRVCALQGVIALLRSMYLLVDPYNRFDRIPPAINDVFLAIVQPLLLVSFQLQYFAYFRIAKVHSHKGFCRHYVHYITWAISVTCIGTTASVYSIYKDKVTSVHFIVQLCYSFWIILAMFWFLYGGILTLRSLKRGRRFTVELRQTVRAELLANRTMDVPKIRITDENERSFSYKSECSATSDQCGTPTDGHVTNNETTSDGGDTANCSTAKKRTLKKSSTKRRKSSPSRTLRKVFYINLVPCALFLIGSALNLYEALGSSTATVPQISESTAFAIFERFRELVIAFIMTFALKNGINEL